MLGCAGDGRRRPPGQPVGDHALRKPGTAVNSLTDCQRCADFYEYAGICMEVEPRARCGPDVGPMCRRLHKADVESIMRAFVSRNLRLDGYDIKIVGLSQYAKAYPVRTRWRGANAAVTSLDADPSSHRIELLCQPHYDIHSNVSRPARRAVRSCVAEPGVWHQGGSRR